MKCVTLKYQNYLFGELGKNYCDIKKFEEFKINFFKNIIIKYSKKKRKFYENIILDLLFFYGEKFAIILKDNQSKEEILRSRYDKKSNQAYIIAKLALIIMVN